MKKPDVFGESLILFDETSNAKEESSNQNDSYWIIKEETLLSRIENFLIEGANLSL